MSSVDKNKLREKIRVARGFVPQRRARNWCAPLTREPFVTRSSVIATTSQCRGFAQKILGGHRPPLQLGVRNCRGALLAPTMYFLCKAQCRTEWIKRFAMR